MYSSKRRTRDGAPVFSGQPKAPDLPTALPFEPAADGTEELISFPPGFGYTSDMGVPTFANDTDKSYLYLGLPAPLDSQPPKFSTEQVLEAIPPSLCFPSNEGMAYTDDHIPQTDSFDFAMEFNAMNDQTQSNTIHSDETWDSMFLFETSQENYVSDTFNITGESTDIITSSDVESMDFGLLNGVSDATVMHTSIMNEAASILGSECLHTPLRLGFDNSTVPPSVLSLLSEGVSGNEFQSSFQTEFIVNDQEFEALPVPGEAPRAEPVPSITTDAGTSSRTKSRRPQKRNTGAKPTSRMATLKPKAHRETKMSQMLGGCYRVQAFNSGPSTRAKPDRSAKLDQGRCLRCVFFHRKCSDGAVCEPCQKVSLNPSLPCIRTSYKEFNIYTNIFKTAPDVDISMLLREMSTLRMSLEATGSRHDRWSQLAMYNSTIEDSTFPSHILLDTSLPQESYLLNLFVTSSIILGRKPRLQILGIAEVPIAQFVRAEISLYLLDIIDQFIKGQKQHRKSQNNVYSKEQLVLLPYLAVHLLLKGLNHAGLNNEITSKEHLAEWGFLRQYLVSAESLLYSRYKDLLNSTLSAKFPALLRDGKDPIYHYPKAHFSDGIASIVSTPASKSGQAIAISSTFEDRYALSTVRDMFSIANKLRPSLRLEKRAFDMTGLKALIESMRLGHYYKPEDLEEGSETTDVLGDYGEKLKTSYGYVGQHMGPAIMGVEKIRSVIEMMLRDGTIEHLNDIELFGCLHRERILELTQKIKNRCPKNLVAVLGYHGLKRLSRPSNLIRDLTYTMRSLEYAYLPAIMCAVGALSPDEVEVLLCALLLEGGEFEHGAMIYLTHPVGRALIEMAPEFLQLSLEDISVRIKMYLSKRQTENE